ncbi:MAG TPA: lipoyl synthase [Deltaproteobacteria bacterium]|nr:lipoyl synthase [Deltaproteobacteria bacterium]HQB38039.1 lipoyl synthase [Deltaproteobacteria bacterium]
MVGLRKPDWLRKKICASDQTAMRGLLAELQLNTVCQQALCPNISECFGCGQLTFLILGRNCTRQCRFCNVDKSLPEAVDHGEPLRVAEAVARLGLGHVVITSPTRDDLDDGGAGHFATTILSIRKESPGTRIEVLIPDFKGSCKGLKAVLEAVPDILAHNLETVPRLYHIRSGADYDRSVALLRRCRDLAPHVRAKSGIMLGLGETREEVLAVFADLREAGCTYLSIGQYLAPSRRHFPVQEYVHPDVFDNMREAALQRGFSHVESGPYVRSSYHAADYS